MPSSRPPWRPALLTTPYDAVLAPAAHLPVKDRKQWVDFLEIDGTVQLTARPDSSLRNQFNNIRELLQNAPRSVYHSIRRKSLCGLCVLAGTPSFAVSLGSFENTDLQVRAPRQHNPGQEKRPMGESHSIDDHSTNKGNELPAPRICSRFPARHNTIQELRYAGGVSDRLGAYAPDCRMPSVHPVGRGKPVEPVSPKSRIEK
jgi:hypothetical protein